MAETPGRQTISPLEGEMTHAWDMPWPVKECHLSLATEESCTPRRRGGQGGPELTRESGVLIRCGSGQLPADCSDSPEDRKPAQQAIRAHVFIMRRRRQVNITQFALSPVGHCRLKRRLRLFQ
ncbi:unnamed protein product [Nezara viridula]|uniref:Uncharacterized protein n=1 Tax=Nezara viridula TaxID=85310 RepID=A0A9P0EBD3_NEZVI|nr:unnamed protein product [Nezara viridula]